MLIKERFFEDQTFYAAVTWDSPNFTNDDMPVAQDPNATFLLHAIHYYNSGNTTRFIEAGGKTYQVPANTIVEQTQNIATKSRSRIDSTPYLRAY